jgi:hypothetical protein
LWSGADITASVPWIVLSTAAKSRMSPVAIGGPESQGQ